MKNYAEYSLASMSMTGSKDLSETLRLLDGKHIDIIIETGTFNGLGSTIAVGTHFRENPPEAFYTIEINYQSYRQARVNLRHLPFVKCLYGCSVPIHEALAFIESDDAIRNHHKYPDIFIDDTLDPVGFYSKEIKGCLGGRSSRLKRLFHPSPAQNLLHQLVQQNFEKQILFILDSAGGVGWMEFCKVMDLMGERSFCLLLDDVHHLKHFRSLQYVKEHSASFDILGHSTNHGWLLCEKNRAN